MHATIALREVTEGYTRDGGVLSSDFVRPSRDGSIVARCRLSNTSGPTARGSATRRSFGVDSVKPSARVTPVRTGSLQGGGAEGPELKCGQVMAACGAKGGARSELHHTLK
jgi:hypothetical protein